MPEDGLSPPRSDQGFAIREARSTDIDDLALLEADRFASDRLSRRSLAALTRSRSADLLVASRAGRPIGYVLALTRRGARTARIYSIAVAADEGGRGVGSRLLDAAEDAARRRGAERMRLEVRADNPSAIRFYKRAGYRAAGRREDYYEDGMEALLFERNLAEAVRVPDPPRRLSRVA